MSNMLVQNNIQCQHWPKESKEYCHKPQPWWSVFEQKFETGT